MQYAETSAVLAWLLGEPAGDAVAVLLRDDSVVTSILTLLECDRVLLRAAARGELSDTDVAGRRARLEVDAAEWAVEPITNGIINRARANFPDDSVRSLDAIHLATALAAASATGPLDVLSLDERVRRNATALGLRVVPD